MCGGHPQAIAVGWGVTEGVDELGGGQAVEGDRRCCDEVKLVGHDGDVNRRDDAQGGGSIVGVGDGGDRLGSADPLHPALHQRWSVPEQLGETGPRWRGTVDPVTRTNPDDTYVRSGASDIRWSWEATFRMVKPAQHRRGR